MSEPSTAFDKLGSLTQKQRDVLDLLVQFKTSKEISRILEISPHTVDQRVDLAKAKLGASSRAQLALIYRELTEQIPDEPSEIISERLTYEESDVAPPPDPSHIPDRVGTSALAPPTTREPSNRVVLATTEEVPSEDSYRVVPELFDGRWGTLARLTAIIGITILLCIAFLGGLTIFVEVSNLLAG